MDQETSAAHHVAAKAVGREVHRRNFLRGALAGTVTLAISTLMPGIAMAAPSRGGLAAVGVRKGARTVHGADGSTVLMPTMLGASMVVQGGELPAGTSLSLTFDTRLYRMLPAELRRGGTMLGLAAPRLTTDEATSRATLTLVVTEPLTPGAYVLVGGELAPHRYPRDLVAQPVAMTVTARDAGGAVLIEEALSKPATHGDLPWGVELGAGWLQAHWDDRYLALYPGLVTVLSTGPAPVPSGTSVRVALDRQVFAAVSVSGARGSAGQAFAGTAGPGRATAGFVVGTWTSKVAIPAGSRVSLSIDAEVRRLSGPLAVLQPPLVDLVTGSRSRTQRLTGQESLTRGDSIYSPATLQEFGSW
jgi:hypothetical protein